jgi:hypothetical protein
MGKVSCFLWHVADIFDQNIPRTNNAIEGWHNAFKNRFGTSRYSFSLLIAKLKDEEEVVRHKRIRIKNNDIIPRRKRFVVLEERLRNSIANHNNRYGLFYIFDIVNSLFY